MNDSTQLTVTILNKGIYAQKQVPNLQDFPKVFTFNLHGCYKGMAGDIGIGILHQKMPYHKLSKLVTYVKLCSLGLCLFM